jgi:hypothetical protein
MTWGGILAGALGLRWRRAATPEQRLEIENRSHLVLLVAVVVLGIRLLNWPLFYATLQSFVPDIDGAMCIFGVTQVKRILTGVAEVIKPVSFFLIGGWLLLHMLDRRTQTSPLMGVKLLFLSVTAMVIVMESLLDVLLMFSISPGTLVSCCTTVTDILDRPTRLVPQSLLGPDYTTLLGYGYYAGTGVLMAALAGLLLAKTSATPPRWRRPILGALFLFAVLNSVLFVLAQIEHHAPVIMGLPFHHCLYCLWQYVPDTILMYLLFVLGIFSVGWALCLDLFGRAEETTEAMTVFLKGLYGFAIFCLGASMVMNIIHLVAA